MKSKEKLNDIKKNLSFGAPKLSGPKTAYLAYTEVYSHVWNIGFTRPGRALDAPEY
jgi:hypothetical protein